MLKGSHHTETSKEKMSEKRLGRPAWNKGKKGLYHHSEESKQKLRERHTGRHHTPESILKMKGRKAWNKGIHGVVVVSEETRKKLREHNPHYWQGKHFSEEHSRKISESHKGEKNKCWGKPSPLKGKPRSEETKEKISQGLKGKRKGVAPWIKGKHHSEESNQKNREKHIGKSINKGINHPMYGKAPWNKGKIGCFSEETIQKLRTSHLGQQPIQKGKTLEELYGVEKAKELKQKGRERIKRIMPLFNIKPNGKELYLDFLLQNHFPDEWKFVGDGQMIIDGLCPDFINITGKQQIIELFGDYWHNKKNMKYHRTEQGRKEAFAKEGYSTLIIWEHELADENKVIEKIKSFSDAKT